MREQSETGMARPPKKTRAIPLALGLLGASFAAQQGRLEYDNFHLNKALAKERAIIGSRDSVRSELANVNRSYRLSHPSDKKIESRLTGQTVYIGGQVFRLRFSEEHGNILVDEDGTQFFATHDLDNTIDIVNSKLRAEPQNESK